MPKNKNATIRYRVLDRCFRNRRRKFFIDDLVEACNEELIAYDGSSVSKRQVQQDILFLESDAGGAIDLERCRDGHKVYFRYRDPDFSILNLPMSQEEAEQLSDTIQMLSRFNGLPQFTWMDEVLVRLKDSFQLDGTVSGSVAFAQNPDLKGIELFSPLFDAIVKKQVLSIKYHRFGKPLSVRVIHPYQLRQYNNRWFLVGLEERLLPRIPLAIIPIDRIDEFKVAESVIFQEYRGADFDDYFYDIVGVSLHPEGRKEKIVIKALFPAASYIETKPIHPSQRILERGDGYIVFQLDVIPNYELETQLIAYADQAEIIEPIGIRVAVNKRAKRIIDLNP